VDSPKIKNPVKLPSPRLYQAAQWWHWWVDELTGMLPAMLRSALLPNVERLFIKAAQDHIVIGQDEDALTEDAETYPLPPQPLEQQQAQTLRKLVDRSREIVLLLPQSKVLSKKIELPLVTESNLREVLGFEMDRQTPFSVNQVYFDHAISKRDSRAGIIEVELVVTPRKYLDDLLARLAETGILPHRASPQQSAQDRNPINLLPEQARPRTRNSARHLNLALTLIALALLGIMIALPMLKQAQRIDALAAEVDIKMRKAQVIQRIGSNIEELSSGANFLVDKRRSTPLVLELIDELTRILPDDTWVNNLTIKGNEVQIQGFSTASAALIPIIEASDRFHNPRFRASVISSQDSDDERFHLSMEISGGSQ
jgi:general secretion pathway protein L